MDAVKDIEMDRVSDGALADPGWRALGVASDGGRAMLVPQTPIFRPLPVAIASHNRFCSPAPQVGVCAKTSV